MNDFWNGFNSLAQQIQVEEIRSDEPTFADWQEFQDWLDSLPQQYQEWLDSLPQEYQEWLDSLPADEPLYFPDGE